jgi:predicted nucleic acid-binding Zn ribbon protein
MARSVQRAAEILKGALARFARSEDPFGWIEAVWSVVLGARLAARARPIAWREGALDVFVHSVAWRRELEEMSETLRAELNRAWGDELVRRLRFFSGEDAPPTPFVRRGAQPSRAGRAGKQPRAKK